MIEDLKQFITATVSQQTAQLERRIDGLAVRIDSLEGRIDGLAVRLDGLEGRIDGLAVRLDSLEGRMDGVEAGMASLRVEVKALDEKLDAIQDAVAETLTHITETVDTQIQAHGARLLDHEQRIHRLERRSV